MPDSSRRRAFTLAELLVVLAIIATVTAILLPALSSMRRSGAVTTDLVNLRQLQVAHLAYATDNAGYLADARLPHGGSDQGIEFSFVVTLVPYADSPLSFRSPLDRSPHWAVDAPGGGQGVPVPGTSNGFRRTSYGIQNFLAREFSPWAAIDPSRSHDRLSKVSAPAGTVHMLLMAETGVFAGSDHPHVEEWGSANQSPAVASTQVATAAAGGLVKSADARSNYSFLDGHVATHRFSEVYIDETVNRFDPTVSPVFDRRIAPANGS